jgi:mannose-6-phosphate isomerase-like protein (cupin superfamily)
MDLHRQADLLADQSAAGKPYLEFLRSADLSAGLYVLPAGAVDNQQPHHEDEIYVVLSGVGKFTAGDEVRDVVPGDVMYVGKEVPHRFHDITADMQLIVVFAPPESMP